METLGLKNKINEIKNSTDGLSSRMEGTKERISKFKYKTIEIIILNNRKKHNEENEQHLRNPLDYKKDLTSMGLESQKKRRWLGRKHIQRVMNEFKKLSKPQTR